MMYQERRNGAGGNEPSQGDGESATLGVIKSRFPDLSVEQLLESSEHGEAIKPELADLRKLTTDAEAIKIAIGVSKDLRTHLGSEHVPTLVDLHILRTKVLIGFAGKDVETQLVDFCVAAMEGFTKQEGRPSADAPSTKSLVQHLLKMHEAGMIAALPGVSSKDKTPAAALLDHFRNELLKSFFRDVALINDMISEWQENGNFFFNSERYDNIRRIGIMGTLDPDYRTMINQCGRLVFAGLFSSTTLFPEDRDSVGEPEEDVAGLFQLIMEHALAAYVDPSAESE